MGNKKTNELLSVKKISFKNKIGKNITFTAPKNIEDDSLTLYLFSDSYIGLDQEYQINLKSLNDKIIQKYGIEVEEFEQYPENEELVFDNW